MDFFDNIDHVFDRMLEEKEADPPAASDVSRDPDLAAQVGDLRTALAEENLAPVLALVAGFNRFRRRVAVAALAGALACLRAVDQDPSRNDTTQTMSKNLKTKRGFLRKSMGAKPLAELKTKGLALGKADFAVVQKLNSYLERLQHVTEINSEDVYMLFAAGLWHTALIQNAPPQEVARLSDLSVEKVVVLQNALR